MDLHRQNVDQETFSIFQLTRYIQILILKKSGVVIFLRSVSLKEKILPLQREKYFLLYLKANFLKIYLQEIVFEDETYFFPNAYIAKGLVYTKVGVLGIRIRIRLLPLNGNELGVLNLVILIILLYIFYFASRKSLGWAP